MAEANDIGPAVPVHVRQLARVLVLAAPTAGARPEGGEFGGERCKVPVAGGQRDIDPSLAEAEDIGPAVPVHVPQLAVVQVIAAPTTGARPEGGEFERRTSNRAGAVDILI